MCRTRVVLKRDGTVLDLVPPPTKVNNLIFGRTWVDSPGEMIMTNLTTGDKVVLYFQPCGWFGYVSNFNWFLVVEFVLLCDIWQFVISIPTSPNFFSPLIILLRSNGLIY